MQFVVTRTSAPKVLPVNLPLPLDILTDTHTARVSRTEDNVQKQLRGLLPWATYSRLQDELSPSLRTRTAQLVAYRDWVTADEDEWAADEADTRACLLAAMI